MATSIVEQIEHFQSHRCSEESDKRNIKKMFESEDKSVLSLWSVFKITAELVGLTHKEACTTLAECTSIINDNWWYNGSHMKIKKGLVNKKWTIYLHYCNEILSKKNAVYRIPHDLFKHQFIGVDEVVLMIKNHIPKNTLHPVIIDSHTPQFDHSTIAVEHSFTIEKRQICVGFLNRFLASTSKTYTAVHGSSDLDVMQLLKQYTNHITVNKVIDHKKVQGIYFNVSIAKNIEQFLQKLGEALPKIHNHNPSDSVITEDIEQLKAAVIAQLQALPDGFVLILTGLTNALVSLSLCQEIYRTLQKNDFFRLLLEIVNSFKGGGKTVKIIFGVSGKFSGIRSEFEDAEIILLTPPTQTQWLERLKESKRPITHSIVQLLPRPTIKPEMIYTLTALEQFMENTNADENAIENFKSTMISAINNHGLGLATCNLLKGTAASEKYHMTLCLVCTALCDDGLTSESMSYVAEKLTSEGISKEEVEVYFQILSPLLKGIECEGEITYEVIEPIKSMITTYWGELEGDRLPKKCQIHYAIARRASYVAFEKNDINRHIQALRHMLKAVASEHVHNVEVPGSQSLTKAINEFENLEFPEKNPG